MISINGILVPVDFSKDSILAAKFAASMAQEYKTKLYVLHVKDVIPSYARAEVMDFEELQEKVKKQLAEDLDKVIPDKVKETIDVEVIMEEGAPTHHIILEKAKELGVDLIVISTHGRTGLAHVMLGSVAEHVIRHAPCPVFVVRNPKDKYVYGWE